MNEDFDHKFNVRQEIPGIEDLEKNLEKNTQIIPDYLNSLRSPLIQDFIRSISLDDLRNKIKAHEEIEEEKIIENWMLIFDNKDECIMKGKNFVIGKPNFDRKPNIEYSYFNENQIELTIEKDHLFIQESPSTHFIVCKLIEKSLLLFPGLVIKIGNCILEIQEVNGSDSITVIFGLVDSDKARYVVENKRVTVGRAKDDYIFNPDFSLTRRHAEIFCTNGIWVIKPIDSKKLYRFLHTTYTIDKNTKSIKTEVFENDIILLGQIEMRVERID